jgi:hypothetical protein
MAALHKASRHAIQCKGYIRSLDGKTIIADYLDLITP